MVPRIPGTTVKGIDSVRAGSTPAFGSLYMARVPEWSKGAVRKTVIRKFESCPVLQSSSRYSPTTMCGKGYKLPLWVIRGGLML